jgi:NADPH:quinone reductase-like Zn-dependent oxidoreductase
MKAIICNRYGAPEVLKLKEVAKPTPRDNELQIKVYATTVTAGDIKYRSGVPFFARLITGLLKPKKQIIGMELSGQIEAVGKDVTLFRIGDPVIASTYGESSGSYAEYVCIPEDGVVSIKPSNVNYEEAAAIPIGGNTASHFLSIPKLQSGQKVLIYGASGSVDTFAVQLAKYYGAEVTGVCSTRNVDLVRSLGADYVIDYTSEDFSKNGVLYDVIFDTVGKSPYSESIGSLASDGFYLLAFFGLSHLLGSVRDTGNKTVIVGEEAVESSENLVYLSGLIEEDIMKPVIDRMYPFDQISEAHRYAEKGHKVGNVIIKVDQSNGA